MRGFLRTVVAVARSAAAYLAVALYTLLVGPPGMLVAALFDRPHVIYWLGRGGVRLGLGTVGIRYRAAGVQHIRADRPAVYCVNHTSNIEPPILFLVLAALHPRLRVLYKAELRTALPLLSRVFDLVGFVPIERKNREQSRQAIDAAVAALRGGHSFLVFPEGTRSRTGHLLPFKKGGFIMAIKAGVEIVPMAIQGARSAMRKGSPVIRPVTVSVRLGAPILMARRSLDDRDEITAQAHAAVRRLLGAGSEPGSGC